MYEKQPRCHGNSEQNKDIAQPGDDARQGTPKTPPIVDEMRAGEVASFLSHEPTTGQDQALLTLFDGAEHEQGGLKAFFRGSRCV